VTTIQENQEIAPLIAESRLDNRRLVSIDVWRGVAALSVVALHVPHYAHGGWRENPCFFLAFLADYGYFGVPFFVIISGFCIHRRAALQKFKTGTHHLRWTQFWVRRIWRLYPTYLAAIAFSLMCEFCFRAPANPALTATWVPDLFWHLILAHNLTSDYAMTLGNGAFWSLGMEEQLYMLYFLLFLLLKRGTTVATVMVVAFFSILWRIALPFLDQGTISLGFVRMGAWHLWPFNYWLHWTLGAIAIDAYMGNVTLSPCFRSVRLALFLIFAGLLIHPNAFELIAHSKVGRGLFGELSIIPGRSFAAIFWVAELIWAVAFFCVINWGLDREARGGFRGSISRALAYIGTLSYSLYLVHVPVLRIFQHHFPFGNSPRDWILRYAVYVPTTLAVGFVFYHCVERWFLTTPQILLSAHLERWQRPATSGNVRGV